MDKENGTHYSLLRRLEKHMHKMTIDRVRGEKYTNV